MIVISDTSPLNYLILIRQATLLHRLCIDQLRQTTMRMPEEIVARMLADDRARRQTR